MVHVPKTSSVTHSCQVSRHWLHIFLQSKGMYCPLRASPDLVARSAPAKVPVVMTPQILQCRATGAGFKRPMTPLALYDSCTHPSLYDKATT
jgi:hypothetical protein